MGVDRNGMSHKPKGLPARVAGTYDTGRQAAGDSDLIDARTIAANLLTDPDIHDIGSLSDLTGRMRAARPGDSDDRPLAHAWIMFDPTTENGGDEERAAIIMRGLTRPLHLDDPDGTLRRLLCLRIRHTALDLLREIRRLGLKEYDTIDPDTADDPYGNMSNDPDAIARERERQREEDRRLMERDRQARAKAKATRERHTHDEYGSMADDYDRFTREYADYWQALGQGAGLTGDAPLAGRMAMARIALRMHDRYDPRRAAAYRRTPRVQTTGEATPRRTQTHRRIPAHPRNRHRRRPVPAAHAHARPATRHVDGTRTQNAPPHLRVRPGRPGVGPPLPDRTPRRRRRMRHPPQHRPPAAKPIRRQPDRGPPRPQGRGTIGRRNPHRRQSAEHAFPSYARPKDV